MEAHDQAAIRRHFLVQSEACESLGSPFTASVCRVLAKVLDETTTVGRRVLSWPGNPRDDALSLRLCGGLHALVLSGADPALASAYPPHQTEANLDGLIAAAIARNDISLDRAMDSPPQTNEIARSAMLLPGFQAIARELTLPLDIFEIGSSAGLNLLFDRFAYDFGGNGWGDRASPVRLAPEMRGGAPRLDGDIAIAGRTGNDIRPIDIADPAERLRLRSYVWADQALRLARLDAAIGLAEQNPYDLERGDAAPFVEQKITSRKPGTAQVLFHSIMWQYLGDAARQAITATMHKAAETATHGAPVAWLRMEPLDTRQPHAMLSLTLWPGGETRHLAKCDYHGRWMEWLA
jgi:hypothetical protein